MSNEDHASVPLVCKSCIYTDCSKQKYASCPIWLCQNGSIIKLDAWQCPICHQLSDREDFTQDCFDKHKIEYVVEFAWKSGKSLAEVMDLCKYPPTIPDHLRHVTSKTRFRIDYLACHPYYAYHISRIDVYCNIYVVGTWRRWCSGDDWDSSCREWKEEFRNLTDHKEDAELTEEERMYVMAKTKMEK